MGLIDLKQTKDKSKHMQLNGRDFLRGLFIVVAVAALTLLQDVTDVRQLFLSDTWINVANATWKPFVAYLLMNIKK